jgi:serine phosphatase RsbU (regulator of sigma subunit)
MYGASDQNWNVTQDSLGRMFVANLNGVMFYDGEYWKIIPIKDNRECVSLAKSKNEMIYAGGGGEFGYLDFSDNDTIKYISMSSSLPEKEKQFGNVWAIHAIDNNVFFCSNERIFWYQDNKFKKSFAPTGEKFHTFFNVGNTLLVREQGVGLLFFKDGALKKILGTGELANTRVYSVLSPGENVFWLFSRNGLYALFFNPNKPEISNLTRIVSPIDTWMETYDIYCGAKLSDNLFALGSIKKGLLLIDRKLNIVGTINYEKGLQDDAVKYIYKDFSGNIWLALNKGLSLVEINSPITFLGKGNNVTSTIESIVKLRGVLYIATDKGISKFDHASNAFVPTSMNDQSWDLALFRDFALAGTSSGLFRIDESGIHNFPEINDVIKRIFIMSDLEHLYLSNEDFLYYVKYEKGKMNVLKVFDYAPGIESFAVDSNKCVYFGTASEFIYLHDPRRPDTLTAISLKDQIRSNNLQINASVCRNSVIFVSDGAIFKPVGYPNVKIIKDPAFDIPELHRLIFYHCIPVGNEVWFTTATVSDNYNLKEDPVFTILSPPAKGETKYSVKRHHYLYRIRGVSKIHCEFIDTSIVYLGTESGLFMYDLSKKESFYKFNTFIARVQIMSGGKEAINYVENYTPHTNIGTPEISYKGNRIVFRVAASDYFNVKLLEFAHYLEGKENGYSGWSLATEINYSDLSEGTYTLHVKSRNVLGIEGNPVSFTFIILPPWYRTYWAYALYFFGSVGLIWFIVRYNTRRLKEQNIKLENIVAERTREVAHQKEEIEHKNQEITDSINYAKRIQQAILPPILEIKKVWKDVFVFYQPKDIVSGDFYWFHKVNDKEMLIACADCTGHGVPGGFMSMICSDKLNDAVKLTKNPAEILFHVNNNVKMALRQNETSDENVNKDGMEISLIKINFAEKKVWYAGANRPMLLLRKNAPEIEELKPNKTGIASFTNSDHVYEGHELQLEQGDQIYLTSDGYPDQFGGTDGKKFMTKNFKKLVLSLRHLSIPDQEQTIKNVIDQWMVGYEQVDDLLVIGLKL